MGSCSMPCKLALPALSREGLLLMRLAQVMSCATAACQTVRREGPAGWTTSTSSSTTEENSEITGRKSWIAKAGTYNQLEMTGHGNDNEGNQQPVHQDNSLPECLPELIPEELCCHPCPPTLPISSSCCYDGYSSNHDLAKNARKNFMVAQPRTGDQQVDGVTLAARPYTEDRQVEGVAGSATNTPYQYIYMCRGAGELSGGIADHANEGNYGHVRGIMDISEFPQLCAGHLIPQLSERASETAREEGRRARSHHFL